MLSAPFQNALVLTGPTGSGKTSLGVAWAEAIGAEIISMDSMALYRGMDIGTAKPGPEERRRIPHHLIDVLDPWESASVAWWLEQAAACCRAIESRGRRVLFVGGTPLYLKALLHGLFAGPPADVALRRRLIEEARQAGPEAVHARLARVDPDAAARLHPNDLRRVIRALEVWELTGRPLSAWQTQWPGGEDRETRRQGDRETRRQGDKETKVFWLDLPRQELYRRIDERVRAMFEAGLVEEVEALRRLPQPLGREAAQAVGYREVLAHLEGGIGLEETIARIQRRTRQFAKRQLTWFRHLPEAQPVSGRLTFAPGVLRME
jgi:tRNA dimethylallyltransferase